MKYSLNPVGMDITEEIERKAEIVTNKFKNDMAAKSTKIKFQGL